MNAYEIGVKLALEDANIEKNAATLIETMLLGSAAGALAGGAHSALSENEEGYGVGRGALTGLGASLGMPAGVALQSAILPKSKYALPGILAGALGGGYLAHLLGE